MSFQFKQERKARKQHQCDCCYRIIQPGEQYIKRAGVADGDFNDAKVCMACDSLIDLVWETVPANSYSDGIAYSDFYEVASDHGLVCWIPHPPKRVAA